MHEFCIPIQFSAHSKERMLEREISIKKEDVTLEYLKKLPYYTDKGCNKYLDWKNQVVYYVRKHKEVYKVETIIKTNKIQMLRNYCDAYRMLCVHKYHVKNECKYCNDWNFNRFCRDHLFGTCKRGENCKFIHKDFD
jgi:hypothetical protein